MSKIITMHMVVMGGIVGRTDFQFTTCSSAVSLPPDDA